MKTLILLLFTSVCFGQNLKISQMSDASTLTGTEYIPLVQSGNNRKATPEQISDYTNSNLPSYLPLAAAVTISSAEILDLDATAKTIVAAPGAGKFIQVLSIDFLYDYGTAQYSGTSLVFRYSAGAVIHSPTISIDSDTADEIYHVEQTITSGYAKALRENTPIVLTSGPGAITNGDGTMKVYITYRIVDL